MQGESYEHTARIKELEKPFQISLVRAVELHMFENSSQIEISIECILSNGCCFDGVLKIFFFMFCFICSLHSPEIAVFLEQNVNKCFQFIKTVM